MQITNPEVTSLNIPENIHRWYDKIYYCTDVAVGENRRHHLGLCGSKHHAAYVFGLKILGSTITWSFTDPLGSQE